MRRKWSRLVAGAVLVISTGVATGSSVTAGAFAATPPSTSARPEVRAVKAVGSYEVSLPSEGSSSQLVIKKDNGISAKEGTFRFTDFGDSGNWLLSGTTISLFVTAAPTSGHLGTVFIGTLTPTGIAPGAYGRPGQYVSWSATRDAASQKSKPPRAPRTAHSPRPPRPPVLTAAGTYTEHFETGNPAYLTLHNSDLSDAHGPLSSTSLDSSDSGNWVTMGKHFAMGFTDGVDAGETFIGLLTTTGISDTTPGASAIVHVGISAWGATHQITCASAFTVDAAHGNNANPGTCIAPFATLTKGLSAATSGETIDLDPGVYDPSNGETFPLTVPAGVTVIGDTAALGAAQHTHVTGDVDLSGAGATIDGVNVAGLVTITGANTTVLNSTVTTGGSGADTGVCVSISGATGVAMTNDFVSSCADIGVRMVNAPTAVFRDDTIRANGEGIYVASGTANLGTKGVDGHDVLSCNSQADLVAGVNMAAWGDSWDHVPPTVTNGAASGGVDIVEFPGLSVNAGFARLAESPCP